RVILGNEGLEFFFKPRFLALVFEDLRFAVADLLPGFRDVLIGLFRSTALGLQSPAHRTALVVKLAHLGVALLAAAKRLGLETLGLAYAGLNLVAFLGERLFLDFELTAARRKLGELVLELNDA